MARWWWILSLLIACSSGRDQAPVTNDQPSQYELEARAIRESFRVVLADFHADVVAGRLDAAYARLAPMLTAGMSPERFAAAAKHPLFQNGVTFTVRGVSETAGTAKFAAFATGPLGTSQLDVRCTQVAGTWKIAGVSVDGGPVLP